MSLTEIAPKVFYDVETQTLVFWVGGDTGYVYTNVGEDTYFRTDGDTVQQRFK